MTIAFSFIAFALLSSSPLTVKKSNVEWYDRVYTNCKAHAKGEEESLQGLIELCNQLNSDIYKAYHNYNVLFEEMTGVHYFQVTYKQMEKALSVDMKKGLEDE
ncbi:BAI1-associated protein 3, partial [Elysia marginata]